MHAAQSKVVVEAQYTPQRIPRYSGNPLIEALPPSVDDDTLIDRIMVAPDFDAEQRDWETHERLQMVAGLSSFLRPMERHVQLARAFDTLIRSGYVGRRPSSVEHVRVFQNLYEAMQAGRAFTAPYLPPTEEQLSSRVIGMSGTGKTTTIRRIFSWYPPVIYHREWHCYQIPYLHIEAPHDGLSTKGLAASILRKIDQLVPDADYFGMHVNNNRNSGELLLNHAARAMHDHFVGVLVVDEIQNLRNAGTSKQTLMSALVTASNELGVPIVFVGTHKASELLGLDFRQGRRSAGHGFPTWSTFQSSGDLTNPGEWEDFLLELFEYQWIKTPVILTQGMSNTMLACSQAVPDIAIKLFACAQWRAMLDRSETFSAATITSVFGAELEPVKRMLDAMRTGDTQALRAYEDIPPLYLSSLLEDSLASFEGSRQRGASVRPGDEEFIPAVAKVLQQAGIDDERAAWAAKKVDTAGKVTGVAAGAEAALALTKPRSPAKSSKKKPAESVVTLAPDDYRHAISRAKADGTTAFSHLITMGAACQLDEVLGL
ncbi:MULTISPECIES: ATP-binding protein [Burkholderiaceae]|uniref:Transposase n=1 Tax=Caballeronia zhejiangensis TaxID=871203 RepID=A0A656QG40_9BURK|nr:MULTISPECIES: ATP-binding protein [Burkholderiaceae]KAK43908.1 transposase [Caballeronia jiangsuensis]KDR28796.1 transposase [Caballeronia zhejiangensis]KWU19227.1 transposase [Burkholderia cenocepacia]SAL57688.1 Transposon Tn7 transposition protein TnsC [Caballeronia peredens]